MSNMTEAYDEHILTVDVCNPTSEQIWIAACKWQIEKDAKICQEMSTNHISGGSFIMNDSYSKSLISVCADLRDAIRNQEPK